jgi:hypothetical protein
VYKTYCVSCGTSCNKAKNSLKINSKEILQTRGLIGLITFYIDWVIHFCKALLQLKVYTIYYATRETEIADRWERTMIACPALNVCVSVSHSRSKLSSVSLILLPGTSRSRCQIDGYRGERFNICINSTRSGLCIAHATWLAKRHKHR